MNPTAAAPAPARPAPPPARAPAAALPIGSVGKLAAGWAGMLALIATEAALFAYLLFSYFYVAAQPVGPWPPDGPRPLGLALLNTAILLASSAAVVVAERGLRRGRRGRAIGGLGVGLLLGITFVSIQWREWSNQPFSLHSGVYGSLFFTITGFHMAHVLVGLGVLAALLLWTALGLFDARRHAALSIGALYWHFVDAVWIAVFASLYLSPYAR